MSLADEIIVMDQGRVLQQGQASAIYHAPRTRTVAEFIGRTNWFEGSLGAVVAPGLREFAAAEGRFIVRCDAKEDAAIGQFCVRPERLLIVDADTPVEEGLNVVGGTLTSAVHLGPEIHHAVTPESGRTLICVEQSRDQAIPPAGARVSIAFRPADCIVTR
jgi:ABC-type Fe3+/spermidine/putrescine transport system ATPase subunit